MTTACYRLQEEVDTSFKTVYPSLCLVTERSVPFCALLGFPYLSQECCKLNVLVRELCGLVLEVKSMCCDVVCRNYQKDLGFKQRNTVFSCLKY